MTIEKTFNRTISYYDDWMRKALPNYHDIFATAQELIPFDTARPIDVLDLGAGTGLFSKHVLEKYPNGRFVLVDLAEKMIEVARNRFSDYREQFNYSIADYNKIEGSRKFDLVISSLSIHHLTHENKRTLFKSIHRILRSGGLFINIDQIRGETPALAEIYWNHWLQQVNKAEQSAERIRESIKRRKDYDIDAGLIEQLGWLKEAGFNDVDCIYKNFFVGVFFAVKGHI